ncbi:hypothetical protein [Paenibacillus lutrae]|uniref:Uncharacterized protein n=1 Tax=Paenibacillus lutrae TaxID=2078573 RepID=A0A7X3K1F4_9BACL|nr:hypothetical protein [Paenibacillus lutrae]MVP02077.1 hypothetical protein [Paenibacillus lutrae]
MNYYYNTNTHAQRLQTANQLEKWKGIVVDITLSNGTVVKGVVIDEVTPVPGDPIESEVTYLKYVNGVPYKNTIQGTHILNVQQTAGPDMTPPPPTCGWVWTSYGYQWICR